MTVRILGEKLVKQAKVIRTQREAARAHKALLEALREEMAMQDERDRERDEEVEELHSQIRISNLAKVKVHRELMENHELMTDLRADNVEAQRKMEELEEGFERVKEELEVARRLGLEREERMGHVEARGDERKAERDELAARLKASERSAHVMKNELERSEAEMDELRDKMARKEREDVREDQAKEVEGAHMTATRPEASVSSGATTGRRGFLGWAKRGQERGSNSNTSLEDQLQERDQQMQSLDRTIQANDDTIRTLRSDMVKMSSTYKQDDFLRRKQIAKLKKTNAEYALKLHSLQKAFRDINTGNAQGGEGGGGGPANITAATSAKAGTAAAGSVSLSMHGESMHSLNSITHIGTVHGTPTTSSSSMHGGSTHSFNSVTHIGTVHGTTPSSASMHGSSSHASAVSLMADKEGRAAMVKMRLGELVQPQEGDFEPQQVSTRTIGEES